MALSADELFDAGIVTLRRPLLGSPIDAIVAMSRKVTKLEREVAQRETLLALYQERVDTLETR